jgi:hypothetical protein
MRRYTEPLIAAGLMVALLLALAAIWFPLLPNEVGKVGADYAFWMPTLLAGYYWFLHNGLFATPWFSPFQCAGIPFHADPQIGYWSLPQIFTFFTDPISAIRAAWIVYAAAGFWGAWLLARRAFARSLPASLLAATLFMLNTFFSTRMAVAHLGFAPFMLLPAFCAALLPPPASPPPSRRAQALRACIAGLILTMIIQGGMAVVLPQLYLGVIAVLLLHAAQFGWRKQAALTLAAGTAIGLALSAEKLVAAASLFGNFPRDLYPLPGIPGPFANTIYVALRSLFWPISNDLGHFVGNSKLIQEPHEFAYGVGLAPPVLLLTVLALAVRKGGWRACLPTRPWPAAALAIVLLIPLALNFYIPGWNAFLKSLPILGSSSVLVRWFLVLMLPAILGAALAADSLARNSQTRAIAIAAGGIVLTLAGLAAADHSAFGSNGEGVFDPDPIEQAWTQAHTTGQVPPVTDVVELFDTSHRIQMTLERQNALVHGYSTLSCYDPLFGYRLEKLPYGKIRLAHAMSVSDGLVNFKNPACYVYPGANQCKPGDEYTEAQASEAQKFLDYQPYAFKKPLIAHAAGWLSLATLLAILGTLVWSTKAYFTGQERKKS